MESNWDIILPAAYFELGVGFYFVENVHYAIINDTYIHFWVDDEDENDPWNGAPLDPGPEHGLERMCD